MIDRSLAKKELAEEMKRELEEEMRVSNEDVIGSSGEDYAVNVFFEERDEGVWFNEELLELVSHNAVQKITIDGVDAVFTLDESGRWKGEGPGLAKQQSWWQRFRSMFKPG